ncbi:MAG: hypothetical protein ACRENP_03630 [Longimicrobiales bacterium]
MRRPYALAALLLAMHGPLQAQSLSQRFSQLFTFGDCGQPLCLSVAGDHGLHYIPSVTQGEHDLLGFLSGSIATSLANLPFTSATSGATFRFVNGVPTATSTSAGAIFGERSQTLGRGRLLAGINVNNLAFDNIRGMPLNNLRFRFAHQNVGAAPMGDPPFENDMIEVTTNLNLNVQVTSVFASYGLSDKIDVGVLIPLVRAALSGTSEAEIIPFSRPTPHVFGTAQSPSEFADASASGSAIGIGDIAVRVKANIYQRNNVGAGVLADVRLPTGDSANFLGSGLMSIRALGIISGRTGNFSPHVNAGVAIRTGETQNHSIVAALGFDHLLAERVTLAVDLLADIELGDSKLELPDRVIFNSPSTRRVRLTDIPEQTDRLLDASVGFKMQLPSDYRFIANLLLPLANGGMRPNYLIMAGFERTF